MHRLVSLQPGDRMTHLVSHLLSHRPCELPDTSVHTVLLASLLTEITSDIDVMVCDHPVSTLSINYGIRDAKTKTL